MRILATTAAFAIALVALQCGGSDGGAVIHCVACEHDGGIAHPDGASLTDGASPTGAPCPDRLPTSGSRCADEGLQCNYPGSCASSKASCRNGVWTVAVPTTNTTCPATVPKNGTTCNRCTSEAICHYPCTGGATVPTEAECVEGTWRVSSGLGACAVCAQSCTDGTICCFEPLNDGGTGTSCMQPLKSGACPQRQ